ncbi:MAG: SMP-30/gluconolactonase/LRE family protein, partial [Planctomycetota bacterium]|nr:SMP-30/gluconolactonase/LRE family protein [Planctomycetota bacterium]
SRHPLAGDWNLATARYFVFDVRTATRTAIGEGPSLVPHLPALDVQWMWWNEAGESLWWIEGNRGHERLTLSRVDPATGVVTQVLEETADEGYLEPGPDYGARPNVRVLEERGEVIWHSERRGYAALDLYDLATGTLKYALCGPKLIVHQIVHVDEEHGWVYFLAGVEDQPGVDPYYARLHRARLDGTRVELLSSELAHHEVVASPSGAYFVDRYSRVDLAPVVVLRDATGRVLLEVARADISELLAAGWKAPERFTVKARDGKTDLYGVLWRPTQVDEDGLYPVLDSIYPGPQISRAPVSFSMSYGDGFGQATSMAELGFCVVAIDGLGTPGRGRAFHQHSRGKLEEAGGLEDHIAGLRQLAERHPYLDLDRVGIYGDSGGGFASTRAILAYPEFYKVAVSAAGNHDNRGYITIWGETYHGLPYDVSYAAQANAGLAANLQGKLLLVHGELDDNVSPALTLQLVDALIKANKDFDLLIVPGGNHSLGSGRTYVLRKRWDYFVRHLLGLEPPREYEIGSAARADRAALRAETEREAILLPGATFEVVAEGLGFGEGPAPDRAGAMYFTDIHNARIHKVDPISGKVALVREDSGRANGLMVTPDGALLICEGGSRQLTRLADGRREVLAERYEGQRLNSPNDLDLDARGGIYFTDPRYGNRDGLELDVEGVYYLDPGGVLRRVIDDLGRPNGLVLSLDGGTLYVADNAAKTIESYAVAADGLLTHNGQFATLDLESSGGGDGMTIDERGNVYCAGQGRVWIWTPEGEEIASLEVGEAVTNVAFGGPSGRHLYITSPTTLRRLRMKVQGEGWE